MQELMFPLLRIQTVKMFFKPWYSQNMAACAFSTAIIFNFVIDAFPVRSASFFSAKIKWHDMKS